MNEKTVTVYCNNYIEEPLLQYSVESDRTEFNRNGDTTVSEITHTEMHQSSEGHRTSR